MKINLYACLLAVGMLTASFAHAAQWQVVRLHVTSGMSQFNSSIDSSIGAFTLETGMYQGSAVYPTSDYIVAWQFGFFGPIYGLTADANPTNPADVGGPPPAGVVDDVLNSINMDMSSWYVWWNGSLLNQGSATATGSYDPLTGSFTLSWQKTIASGPLVGFPVAWYLTGYADVEGTMMVTMNIDGEAVKECSQPGGTPVSAYLDITVPDGLSVADISWYVDNQPVANGVEQLQYLIPMGTHVISADVTSNEGVVRRVSNAVEVRDTTGPQVEVGFIDKRSGTMVTSIDSVHVNKIITHIVATDACDPEPVVSSMGGFEVENGDLLKIRGKKGVIRLTSDYLTLRATATDASGHSASGDALLQVSP